MPLKEGLPNLADVINPFAEASNLMASYSFTVP
jgi:hypothetical protein